MKPTLFTPKHSIDEYKSLPGALFIYKRISLEGWSDNEALDYLNFLYQNLEYIRENKEQPSKCIEYLMQQSYEKVSINIFLNDIEVLIWHEPKIFNSALLDSVSKFESVKQDKLVHDPQLVTIVELIRVEEIKLIGYINSDSSDEFTIIRNGIFEKFRIMDKKGWEYAFKNKQDLDRFMDILTCFFTKATYTIPPNKINLMNGSTTKVAHTLKEIYKYNAPVNSKLNSDTKYFEIIKILDAFSELNDTEIYYKLT